MTVTLPDGSRLELPEGATGHDAAAAIGPGLAKAAVAVRVGDEIRDLGPAPRRRRRDPDRHAQERRRLPLRDAPLGRARDGRGRPERRSRGPSSASARRSRTASTTTSTCRGRSPRTTSRRSRPRSRASSPPRRPFQRTRHEHRRRARATSPSATTPYKVDQIDELDAPGRDRRSRSTASATSSTSAAARTCTTPGGSGTVKLQSVAGAYWRGSEKNPPAHPDLRHRLPQRRRTSTPTWSASSRPRARDHRRLGPRARPLPLRRRRAPGFPFFLPKGMVIVNGIKAAVRERARAAWTTTRSRPRRCSTSSSGRPAATGTTTATTCTSRRSRGSSFAIKPMNCPGACLVYRSRRHSYRDLPIRYAEFGHVHRHELLGRAARPASACGPSPRTTPTSSAASTRCRTRSTRSSTSPTASTRRFGFDDVELKLSTRPEKADRARRRCGTRAEEALRDALGRPRRTASRWATAPSTARRSTSRSPT